MLSYTLEIMNAINITSLFSIITLISFGCLVYSDEIYSREKDKGLSNISIERTQQISQEEKIAVLVGISNYPSHGGLTSLQYADKDAISVGKQLERLNYKTVVLTNDQATVSAIRNVMLKLGQYLEPNKGTFLFYFSGHGFSKKKTNYLATYESSPDTIQHTGLSLDNIIDIMRSTGAKRNILFVDACRNTPETIGKSLPSQRSFSGFNDSEGTQILFSTKFGGKSYEYSNLKHGVYTYFLLSGLQGNARKADGIISFRDLAQYVSQKVKQYSYTTKQVQVPFVAGEYKGDFLIHADIKQRNLNLQHANVTYALTEPTTNLSNANSLLKPTNFQKMKKVTWYRNLWIWIGVIASGTALYYSQQDDSNDGRGTVIR